MYVLEGYNIGYRAVFLLDFHEMMEDDASDSHLELHRNIPDLLAYEVVLEVLGVEYHSAGL